MGLWSKGVLAITLLVLLPLQLTIGLVAFVAGALTGSYYPEAFKQTEEHLGVFKGIKELIKGEV